MLVWSFLVSASSAAGRAEVPLTWAWPSGLDLPVRVDVIEVVEAGGEARRRCFSVSGHLRTQRDDAGLRVWVSELADVIPADQCPQFVELRPFVPPRFVVGSDADVLAVEGTADRETRDWWNRRVGFWTARTARKEPETVRVTRALPSLGWEPDDIAITAALSDVRRRGDEVVLSLALTPDPADVLEYFRRLHASAPELGGAVGSASLTEQVDVTASPLTLVPAAWRETLAVSLTMADPPGTATRRVETTWTFLPPPEPPRR